MKNYILVSLQLVFLLFVVGNVLATNQNELLNCFYNFSKQMKRIRPEIGFEKYFIKNPSQEIFISNSFEDTSLFLNITDRVSCI